MFRKAESIYGVSIKSMPKINQLFLYFKINTLYLKMPENSLTKSIQKLDYRYMYKFKCVRS